MRLLNLKSGIAPIPFGHARARKLITAGRRPSGRSIRVTLSTLLLYFFHVQLDWKRRLIVCTEHSFSSFDLDNFAQLVLWKSRRSNVKKAMQQRCPISRLEIHEYFLWTHVHLKW